MKLILGMHESEVIELLKLFKTYCTERSCETCMFEGHDCKCSRKNTDSIPMNWRLNDADVEWKAFL